MLTVGASALWLFVAIEIAERFENRRTRAIAQNLRANMATAVENPNTSKEHKNALRRQVEQMELIIAQRDISRLKAMAAITDQQIKDLQAQLAKKNS
jgi:hypothetical protein